METYIKSHTGNDVSGARRLDNRALKSRELCVPAQQLKDESISRQPLFTP